MQCYLASGSALPHVSHAIRGGRKVPTAARQGRCNGWYFHGAPIARSAAAHQHTAGGAAEMEQSSSTSPLFQKLGGAPAVKAAVDVFYDKMLADPRVAPFFEGVNMAGQRAHQVGFLTYAMGGADHYDGNANMTTAHERLVRDMGLTMEHFDIVVEHLGASLADLSVPQDLIAEAAATVETLRPAFQAAIDNCDAARQS